MQIRLAQASDVVALHEIVKGAYGIYVGRIGRRPGPMDDDYAEKLREGDVFVADRNGEVVGLIVLLVGQDHVLIENVAVDPKYQGNGIGRALLDYAEVYATEQRLAELRLYTNAAMSENLALYPRLGYREDDRRTENGFSRVFFSKRLPTPSMPDVSS